MSLLAKGQALLTRLLQRDATPAGAVTYRRGSESVVLTGKAWVGRTVFSRVPRDGGAAVVFGDRDYLIPAADLVVEGKRFEPERGHQVVEVIDGTERTFELISPAGEPAWRWADPGRTFYRVHTQEQA